MGEYQPVYSYQILPTPKGKNNQLTVITSLLGPLGHSNQ
jgi:hypothetical protein